MARTVWPGRVFLDRVAIQEVLTATKIQKNVTERCGPETASSTFRAMTPPRTAETPAMTSTTWEGTVGQRHLIGLPL